MSPTSVTARDRRPFLERLGFPRAPLWGHVGLALFMIGDGVDSNSLVTYFVNDLTYSDLLADNVIQPAAAA